jgi:hypothetical protein
MTAKKYVENATSDRLVVFQRDIFKDFVNQLCKEQRELCWEDMKGFDYEVPEDRNVAKNIILNAKQPEV